MNFFDSVKNTVGGAVESASKDENVRAQVKDTMTGTVEKIAGLCKCWKNGEKRRMKHF